MAAPPVLRHYRANLSATAAVTGLAVVPAVAAGRALVVSKVVVVNYSGTTAHQFELFAPGVAFDGYLAGPVTLNVGEVYTESGLVLLAGELLVVRSPTSNPAITVSVHGEEVDN